MRGENTRALFEGWTEQALHHRSSLPPLMPPLRKGEGDINYSGSAIVFTLRMKLSTSAASCAPSSRSLTTAA